MKVKKGFNSGLQFKLLVIYLVITIFTLLVAAGIVYINTYNMAYKKSQAIASLQAKQITDDIDRLINDLDKFSNIRDIPSVITFLQSKEGNEKAANEILDKYKLYRETHPLGTSILDISIYGIDGKVLNEFRGIYKLKSPPMENLSFTSENNYFISPVIENGFPAISYLEPIYDPLSNTIKGYLKIVMDATPVLTILSKNAGMGARFFYIESSKSNEMLFPLKLEKKPPTIDWKSHENENSGTILKDDFFIVYETSKYINDWKVVGVTPAYNILEEAYDSSNFIIAGLILLHVLLFIFYFFYTKKRTGPIRTLKEKMKQAAEGDINVRILNTKGDSDEISQLIKDSNKLISQIRLFSNERNMENRLLRMAEFRTMQEQINPHFLYNTLETIIWMSEAKKHEQVIDVTKAMALFFRISLSKGRDLITIHEEIEHIKNYLFIQKVRYEDILDFTFHINKEILDCKILKLSLQPLVENAIYHGIKNKRGKGFLLIKGDINAEGNIIIEIIDNGIGMSGDKLDELRLQIAENSPKNGVNGVGMLNVHQRIRTFYGEAFGLSMTSWQGSGTRVCLTIPQVRGDSAHEEGFSG